MRTYNILRLLTAMGYHVTFLPEDGVDTGPHAEAVQAIGVEVCGRRSGPTGYSWFLRNHESLHAIVVARYHLAWSWWPLVKEISPELPRVLDTVDLHYLRESREAELSGNPWLMRTALATRAHEWRAVKSSSTTWVVSDVERALLQAGIPGADIKVVPNLHSIQSGIGGPEEREGLIFVGGARHPPNVDGLEWFLAEVYPVLHEMLRGCPIHLVGEGLPESLAHVPASRRIGVEIHGHVPDIGPLLSRAKVGIAPLRFGAGVKGKINQYMSYGIPTVATPMAIEGMHLSPGRDVLAAEAPEDFAAAVATVYRDIDLWRTISAAGLDNVRAHFSDSVAIPALHATFLRPMRNDAPACR
ncbi:MAG: glycosyltransferase [Pseudoxanthomonas sp.]|nr:glycosyltransferase [Pseudoxanthomonas sp.]